MLKVGEKLWNGVIVWQGLADSYNAATARIQGFERAGVPVPDHLLNGRHNLLASTIKESRS